MRKNILIIFCLFVSTLNGWCGDYKYLVFSTSSGPKSIAADHLEMTVSDGKLVVSNGTESGTFELSALSSMYFSQEATTSIGEVEARATQAVSVHDLAGRFVGRYPSLDTARKLLPKGLYVVGNNGKNIKLAVR